METIELDLSEDEMFRLMQLAHEQDITLNQLISNILQQVVDMHEEPDCNSDDGYSFKTAGFGTDEDYGPTERI
jgi:hypothetical protein